MTPIPTLDPRLVRRLLTLYRTPGESVEDEIVRVISDPNAIPYYRDAVVDAARNGMGGHIGERQCRFCDAPPFNSKGGRMSHEALAHPVERLEVIPAEQIAREYLEEYTPIRALATAYGVSVVVLKRILAEQGVKVRGTGVPKGRAA